VSRRAAELGVHMAIIRGRFVVFVAVTIAAGAVAEVVGGADQAPAVKQEACPSAVSCQAPSLVQLFAEVGPHRIVFFVQVVGTMLTG